MSVGSCGPIYLPSSATAADPPPATGLAEGSTTFCEHVHLRAQAHAATRQSQSMVLSESKPGPPTSPMLHAQSWSGGMSARALRPEGGSRRLPSKASVRTRQKHCLSHLQALGWQRQSKSDGRPEGGNGDAVAVGDGAT